MSGEEYEYRVARFRERLTRGEVAELGVRIEVRGEILLLTGTLPTADRREEILRIAEAELTGIPFHEALVVAGAEPPDHHEELR
ncbi:hypothetical protein EAO70_15400 [Streptomyces sp. adm13(2018)]|uniref:hypothetical protein n=1 Tax=unclassified Streptomyces TaxID=2593676 RepID=UPI0011CDB0C4|nr:hypothetical protein [Streptomyces sp. adm13(2018)]TXS15962.1 hypothetical protein EAO70_15400 [Streptomyces sp. adm13(2018)]